MLQSFIALLTMGFRTLYLLKSVGNNKKCAIRNGNLFLPRLKLTKKQHNKKVPISDFGSS